MSLRTRLGIDIDADTTGVDRGVGRAQGRLGKFSGFAVKAGRAAAVGLGAVGVAAGYVGKEVSESASRTQQAMGAIEAVFGSAAGKVEDWADRAALAVGLSKAEYSELATIVGSQLQNMGVTQDASAKRSKELIGLGADLAATYGGSVADAVSAVSSLMRGEADPIERYGVSIKRADINARMAAEGLDDLEGKAKKQAETQVLLAMLTEQTANAQGMFASEADTLAGSQERLGAQIENLKSKLGEHLLPALTRVTRWASERLLPALERLGERINKDAAPAMRRLGAWIQNELVPALRRLHDWFTSKIMPVIRETGERIIPRLQAAFDKVKKAIDDNREPLEKLFKALGKVVEFVTEHWIPFFGSKWVTALEDAAQAVSDVISVIGWLVEKLEAAYNWAKKAADAVKAIPGASTVAGFLGDRFGRPGAPGDDGGASTPPGDPFNRPGTPPAPTTTINVNVAVPATADPDATARAIVTAINGLYQRLGLPVPHPGVA